MSKTTTYYALSNVLHDNKPYSRGDAIEMTDVNAANVLLKDKIISRSKPSLDSDFAPVEEESDEDKALDAEDIMSAGGQPSNSGEPSVDGQESQASAPKKEDKVEKTDGNDADADANAAGSNDADAVSDADTDLSKGL